MAHTELNAISISEICVYTPFLVIAVFLAIRHGLRHNASWLYLIIFTVRILSSALELATINDPTNISLYVRSLTLQTVGLSPLILAMLAFTTCLSESINKTQSTPVNTRNLRIVQLLVLVGLILGIVGGTSLSSGTATPYTVPAESVAGLALITAGCGLLCIATAVLAVEIRSAEPGEKRLLLTNVVALPFVLIRIVFSAMGTFTNNPSFR